MTTKPLQLDDPGNILWPYVGGYRERLDIGRYRGTLVRRYVACVLHFGNWLRSLDHDLSYICEAEVYRFLDDHLPRCGCPRPVSTELICNRAALNHLVRHLRQIGEIAEVTPHELTHELAAFDRTMAMSGE